MGRKKRGQGRGPAGPKQFQCLHCKQPGGLGVTDGKSLAPIPEALIFPVDLGEGVARHSCPITITCPSCPEGRVVWRKGRRGPILCPDCKGLLGQGLGSGLVEVKGALTKGVLICCPTCQTERPWWPAKEEPTNGLKS